MALSIKEMPPQDEQFELLLNAIDSASRDTLQAVLKVMCRGDQSTRDRVSKSLLITEDQVPIIASEDEGSDGEESGNEEDAESEENSRSKERRLNQKFSGSKRLRQRYAYCENCDKEFDVTQNTNTSCKFHPDYCHPDGEFFVDDDQYDNGDYDNGEALEEFPEGYIYECCDRRADEEPCTVDKHRERISTKRQRLY
ncbi:hypothetical protein BDV38DRAFT_289227 [Aspergillus pseudotamarii]|uniref:C2H2-type domain-containing protein n=1 Tax=Aspergillus pseudotamarii TaxID=132259 RepID=A0A5N6SA82_ASPPS|nr:uncharacterized protein BDV38DRAFT_289227 [Aspergillus pseudotamarii]KAE8130887.1 hypothetical protein BDV38DRAFT_289227 [Aspergillus pseudotamarii]